MICLVENLKNKNRSIRPTEKPIICITAEGTLAVNGARVTQVLRDGIHASCDQVTPEGWKALFEPDTLLRDKSF